MSAPDEGISLNTRVTSLGKKSFYNGISSFFKQKGSHINAFSIELEDPIKKYGPGEAVQGKVVVDVARPLGVTHIVVRLSGYAQVFKNQTRSSSNKIQPSTRVASGRGKRWVSEYYGDGYMSLFDEEVVLCGEGRLDPKHSPFHFQFNLEFPEHFALPSSIDFDKGTISYLITSTITRPAYTTGTISCQTKVGFLEDIDVALLPAPKVRAVTLRPENTASSPRGNFKRLTSFEAKRSQRASSLPTTIDSAKDAQSQPDLSSTLRTSGSADSNGSTSSGERKQSNVAPEARSVRVTPSLNGENNRSMRNITVSAELCKSGCLPGRRVPILVQIHHNKVIRNPSGILVSLYRQARVDMHPHLPLASNEKSTAGKYEDYYPRSRTGLGGLSLSAAGSSQVWRKDLSQTTAPLYIDPQTMFQEIKIGVYVPELPEAFPSIRNVPGQMISFRYMVEVIIDIHGKAIGQLQSDGRSNGTANVQVFQNSDGVPSASQAGEREQLPSRETLFLDTTRLRRDKNTITIECELVVGTRDSQRRKDKQKRTTTDDSNSDTPPQVPTEGQSDHATSTESQTNGHEDYNYGGDSQWEPRWDEQNQRWLYVDQWGHIYDDDWNFVGYDQAYEERDAELPGFHDGPELIPPPDFSAGLSEKDRLMAAEQALFPSRPPADEQEESQDVLQQQLPTAPILGTEHVTDSQSPSTPHISFTTQPQKELDQQPSSSAVDNSITSQSTIPSMKESSSESIDVENNIHQDSSAPPESQLERRDHQRLEIAPTAPPADEIDQLAEPGEGNGQENNETVEKLADSISASERTPT